MTVSDKNYVVQIRNGDVVTTKFVVGVFEEGTVYTMQNIEEYGENAPFKVISKDAFDTIIEVAKYSGKTVWTNKPRNEFFYEI